MEDNGYLDISDKKDLFCLQYVYVPRINRHISMFLDGYHNHPIRTESNRTPLQLWVEGQHNYQPIQNDLITDTDMETYGIHWEGPLPLETFSSPNDQDTGISIPEFSNLVFDHLALEIDPLQESSSNGVDVYLLLRDYVKQFLE